MPGPRARGLAGVACAGAGAAGACAAVGLCCRGGCRAVVACLARAFARPCRRGLRWGRGCRGLRRAFRGARAAGVAAGFSRGQGPGLGSALLAVVRFRGAARGPLRSAGRGALSCMGRAAGGAGVPVCGLPGANNNPTNIAKNQCRANINHNILSPQHAILPHSSQKVCRGSLPE